MGLDNLEQKEQPTTNKFKRAEDLVVLACAGLLSPENSELLLSGWGYEQAPVYKSKKYTRIDSGKDRGSEWVIGKEILLRSGDADENSVITITASGTNKVNFRPSDGDRGRFPELSSGYFKADVFLPKEEKKTRKRIGGLFKKSKKIEPIPTLRVELRPFGESDNWQISYLTIDSNGVVIRPSTKVPPHPITKERFYQFIPNWDKKLTGEAAEKEKKRLIQYYKFPEELFGENVEIDTLATLANILKARSSVVFRGDMVKIKS